ncbi:MAG: NADH-quinone oxidoreductase subunit C [Bordetella sp. SCN 67-23]|uniref:NADH-quinone oxidoreductase subunit C n=1 Tax=unclassified Pigmentiphaga TaxID=2626614 RepID=UPI00086BCB19|nr:NADH-quinone oxidoreductase subunit C [Pigmentiphaga sp. H8]MBN9478291.1 NADH-quinone oxidoreductase subunit C [Burkholderiales bacterium]ODS74541.1 MAG: NADH-quinone oxidoreductase subunit C [Bordetella sp. SCN 67-23]ODU77174.1 MAG: NADH-quinone oxidoreductase subunit C [Bordetella sp. SCN 68-11]OJW90569.1 MAG: NADH-quinone oxidoreductase subunit C [Burkholderiales bacterium 67-32]AZG08346.1 NADH-quinone oxidoreductase subunit C [Pigmentiphaga sp. H8]
MTKLETLRQNLLSALGEDIRLTLALGELTLEVPVDRYVEVCRTLRDDAGLSFESCIDLCGVDYSTYGNEVRETGRFAVVLHLISIAHNWRLRVRTYAADDDMPVVPSLVDVWSGVNWYEREAFDFYGVLFEGHPDLRRILTDYGFIGHPFRKDFPLSGTVEMRFDPEQKRVIYQPVTIEPREVTPRVIREDGYGAGR